MNTLLGSFFRAVLASSVLAVAALVPASYARGQSPTLRVNIPFNFENGSQHLPAGNYSISSGSSHMTQLRSTKGGGFIMTLRETSSKANPSSTGKVIFNKYGNRYFLHQIWEPGETSHLECVQSRAEKHVQLALAEAAHNGTEVATLEALR